MGGNKGPIGLVSPCSWTLSSFCLSFDVEVSSPNHDQSIDDVGMVFLGPGAIKGIDPGRCMYVSPPVVLF
jgi:hypothetical protein